jgi:hypothetical protein
MTSKRALMFMLTGLASLAVARGTDATTAVDPAPQASTKATTPPPPPAPKMTMKEAKVRLGITVFPSKGQSPAQQETDEVACLQWAADQAGLKVVDPQASGAAAKAQAEKSTQGAGVAGAAKGAAVGAIIGSISGNASQGAGYGAVAGAIGGRRAKKSAEANAEAQGKAQADAQNKAMLDAVKKGMAMCLESKGYSVK